MCRYIPELGGVLLGWSHVRFEDLTGDVILWMIPTVRVRVRLKVYVCVPSVWKEDSDGVVSGLLRARVKSVGQDYVALTALHYLHVTVPRARIPSCLLSQLCPPGEESRGQLVQVAIHKYSLNYMLCHCVSSSSSSALLFLLFVLPLTRVAGCYL
jgi:hypothetical protein